MVFNVNEIKRFFQISKNDAVALRALALRIHQAEETKNQAAAEVWRKHFSDIAVDVIMLGFDQRQVAGLENVAQKILAEHEKRPINAYTWADDALAAIGICGRPPADCAEDAQDGVSAMVGGEEVPVLRLPRNVWEAVLDKTDSRLRRLGLQQKAE